MTGTKPKPFIERFLNLVFYLTYDRGCWLWTGALDNKGQYGLFAIPKRLSETGRKTYDKAHRVSWKLFRGNIPPETPCVLHRCDVTSCVRPDHLFLGTRSDNNKDRDSKGRTAFGVRIGAAVLNPNSVAQILQLSQSGLNFNQVAKRFGVAHGTVSAIVRGKTWKHLGLKKEE